MSNFAPKECYRKAFVTINGSNYRCLGLVNELENGRYKFVGEATYSRGYIERVADANWRETPELPKELECRNWVQSTHFGPDEDDY